LAAASERTGLGFAAKTSSRHNITEALMLRVGRAVLDSAALSLSLRCNAPDCIVLESV